MVTEFKLAIAHTTAWMFLFLASGHPLEEWAVTALVLYISVWASKEIILRLGLFALRHQANYGKRIMRKAGVELPENLSAERNFGVRLLSTCIILHLFAVVIGASLSFGIPASVLLGLTPLAYYFSWLGWVLLGVGLTILWLFFAVTWLTLVGLDILVDSLNEDSGKRIVSFYAITERAAAFAGATR